MHRAGFWDFWRGGIPFNAWFCVNGTGAVHSSDIQWTRHDCALVTCSHQVAATDTLSCYPFWKILFVTSLEANSANSQDRRTWGFHGRSRGSFTRWANTSAGHCWPIQPSSFRDAVGSQREVFILPYLRWRWPWWTLMLGTRVRWMLGLVCTTLGRWTHTHTHKKNQLRVRKVMGDHIAMARYCEWWIMPQKCVGEHWLLMGCKQPGGRGLTTTLRKLWQGFPRAPNEAKFMGGTDPIALDRNLGIPRARVGISLLLP